MNKPMSLPERNGPCPCGSGRKFKKCCSGKSQEPANRENFTSSLRDDVAAVSRFIDGGQFAYAENLCRQILRAKPDHAETWFHLGLALQLSARGVEAADAYQEAIKAKKNHFQAMGNLGMLLVMEGKFDQAVACLRKAIALQPGYVEAHNNLGVAFQKQAKFKEAIDCYRKTIELDPAYATAHNNLGNIFKAQDDFDEAIAWYRKAIAAQGNCVEAYNNLGVSLQEKGESGAAIDCYRKAIALQPDFSEAHFNLGKTHGSQGNLDEAISCYRTAIALKPDYADAHTNLLLTELYAPAVSAGDLFADHRRFAEQCENPLKPRWRRRENDPNPDRRLKIGYVSADFRKHVAAYFIEPVLANHDKNRVEVHCYYNHRIRDEVTDRIEAMSDRWVPCGELSDDQLAQQVSRDGIDILVDLSGHTAGNRLLAFARKPAPVQATWIGYAGTTGLAAMDYRITDPFMDPPGITDRYHTEELVRLPASALFRPAEESPPVNELPALTSGAITFACLNNLRKLNPDVVELWGRILTALPDAKLVLGNAGDPDVRQRILAMFCRYGVSGERLVLHPEMPLKDYLALHAHIDLALDPFPYNGGTSTHHSLWMGVPVITLAGDKSVSRVGASIMMRAGLPEFVAQDKEEYLQRALRLARDRPALDAIRRSLRERVSTNPDNDPLRLTRNLEDAYRNMWRKWCAAKTGDQAEDS